MPEQGLPAAPALAGFRGSSAVDESPEGRRRTRVAVARARGGDVEALSFLYANYSNNVYGYVRSIVGEHHDAEDVTQQVFTKLMTRLVKYDERGSPFLAWLLRVARNVAIDHLRANRVTPVQDVFDPHASCLTDRDLAPTVGEALATLPQDQREVVILRNLVGLTPNEIAARMGRTESAIHGLHHRGRRALQLELTRLGCAPVVRVARQCPTNEGRTATSGQPGLASRPRTLRPRQRDTRSLQSPTSRRHADDAGGTTIRPPSLDADGRAPA